MPNQQILTKYLTRSILYDSIEERKTNNFTRNSACKGVVFYSSRWDTQFDNSNQFHFGNAITIVPAWKSDINQVLPARTWCRLGVSSHNILHTIISEIEESVAIVTNRQYFHNKRFTKIVTSNDCCKRSWIWIWCTCEILERFFPIVVLLSHFRCYPKQFVVMSTSQNQDANTTKS